MNDQRLRIGFIPLCDAAALLIAVDGGFAAAEGLEIELVREVSWSNMRDKLNIGLFDAAHMIAPIAIASSLGLGHVKVPIVAPFVLGVNGNAITVSPALYASIAAAAEGNLSDPLVSARALACVVAGNKAKGRDPLTFGMTFPFSTHNYQLRFWIAAGGVDPDEDVRLVVLPPPYMVESLADKQVDGFCVGAPWNSVAVNLGIGFMLHFGSEIVARGTEKVLALRSRFAQQHPETLAKLVRAHARAAAFIDDRSNSEEVTAMLARADRIDVPPDVIRRTLDGRMKVAPDGATRIDPNYLLIGRDGAGRPDPAQAAWLYAQMVRWGQATLSDELRDAAMAVFRPDLYDAAVGSEFGAFAGQPPGRIGPFAGPAFDPGNIAAHLAAWRIGSVAALQLHPFSQCTKNRQAAAMTGIEGPPIQ